MDPATLEVRLDDCIWVLAFLKEIRNLQSDFSEDVHLRVITYLYRLKKNDAREVLRILIMVRTWLDEYISCAANYDRREDNPWYQSYRCFFEDYYHGQFLDDSITTSLDLTRIPLDDDYIISIVLYANNVPYSTNFYRRKKKNGIGEEYPNDNMGEEIIHIYPCVSSVYESNPNNCRNKYVDGRRSGDFIFIGRTGPVWKRHYINGLENEKSYFYAEAPPLRDYTLDGSTLIVTEAIPENRHNEELVNSLRKPDKDKAGSYVVLRVSNYLNGEQDGRQLVLHKDHSLHTICRYHNFREVSEETYTFVGMNVCYRGVNIDDSKNSQTTFYFQRYEGMSMNLLSHLTYDENNPYYKGEPIPLIDMENHIIHGLMTEEGDSMETYLCLHPLSL